MEEITVEEIMDGTIEGMIEKTTMEEPIGSEIEEIMEEAIDGIIKMMIKKTKDGMIEEVMEIQIDSINLIKKEDN